MKNICLSDAKANLSALVDEAMEGRPSVITRRGKPQAVILSYEQWKRLASTPFFGRLLMSAPLEPNDLSSRNQKGLRGCVMR